MIEMNIDEAIEILNDACVGVEVFDDPELRDAIKLGIEALKAIKDVRTEGCYQCPPKLPGEMVGG